MQLMRYGARTRLWRCLALGLVFVSLVANAAAPQVHDSGFTVSLFAEQPQIVTPIGLAVADDDRVFVIESHTHLRPVDYRGPDSDLIKVFVDQDQDGRAERVEVFASGLKEAMNLAFSPDGVLYAVCSRQVVRLPDRDKDGRCDGLEVVLQLETRERYAHNSLLGITFDREKRMYVARGNTGSHAYQIRGPNGLRVEGYGDGGSVLRCREDGSELQEFATGFWNPFDLKFDRHGRLFLVDNDPDARGPNRLVQVVQDGDYGYKSMYGGSGNHPFQGWDGSLPGTLPSLAGTGEAPSGLIDCWQTSFPKGYRQSLLVTIWNEHSIERFDLRSSGTSKSVFLSGEQDFRPVALGCDRQGNLYVSDWVKVAYPNHGHGRIWRVQGPAKDRTVPGNYFAPYQPHAGQQAMEAIAAQSDRDSIKRAVLSDDPFHRHVAQSQLRRHPELIKEWAAHRADPRLRLAALLAARRLPESPPSWWRNWLGDEDLAVRIAALTWIGDQSLTSFADDLQRALRVQPISRQLFETYLAAVANLDPHFVIARRERREPRANRLVRRLRADQLVELAKDGRLTSAVRGLAVSKWPDAVVQDECSWLVEQLQTADTPLALAIVRRWGQMQDMPDEAHAVLVKAALSEARSSQLRGDALLALSTRSVQHLERFERLLMGDDEDVAVETARTFRSWMDLGIATTSGSRIRAMAFPERRRTAIQSVLTPHAESSRPSTDLQWEQKLMQGGNPIRGRRVFFSSRIGCSKCHRLDGVGGALGPGLGYVARSKTRQQIIRAILQPSAEFPPQYQAWLVVTVDGQTHRGLQLDHKRGGDIEMLVDSGELVHFGADEIELYEASPTSLMPAGLADTMTVDEFRDLIAFLCTLGDSPLASTQ